MRLPLCVMMVLFLHSITFCQNQPVVQNSLYQVWVREYAGPLGWESVVDIAVDQSGNVYLASQSFDSTTSYDYAIIKYSSDGTEEWVARYTKPGRFWDLPEALAVDVQGNVYVTGRSEESYETGYDILTIKYDSEGVEQWTVRYNGPGDHWDQGTDIAVDQSGNVYVVGHTSFSHTDPFNENYATIKYRSEGDQEWIAFYDGPVGLNDYARVLAVDDSGNVYVTGWSASSTLYPHNFDYLTVKYDSKGVEQWAKRYDGPAHDSDFSREIALDDSGNVYVTGTSQTAGQGEDYATIKYSAADGEELWVARYNGPHNLDDQAFGLARDNSGNIYVTGSTGFDYATIKYDSDGIERWIAIYEGPPHTYGRAVDIVVDDLGYVFIFGWVLKYDGSNHDYALVRYDSSGTESATVTYNTHPNTDDWAEAMAMDRDGNIYVTGSGEFQGSPKWSHIFTIKYSQLPLSIVRENNSYPKEPQLYQNHPNPFNSSTRISYSMSQSAFVTLKIYDMLGREIETLVSEFQETGTHSISFDATKLSSGIYFYGLGIDDRFTETKKMLVIR